MVTNAYRGKYISMEFQSIGSDNPYFDTHDFLREMKTRLTRETQKEAEQVVRYLNRVTETWKHEVNFDITVDSYGDTFYFRVTTDDEIFWYLNNGTDKRYAVMTQDFIPKTRVRRLESFEGRGEFSHWDMNDARARNRAIEAREWIEEIADDRRSRGTWYRHMDDLFHHIVKVYWGYAHRKAGRA